MKMTRLEWRYLKKIALDHPYFDTHPLPITEEEADAIVKANVTRTGKEFVDSIYAELGMTRPERKKGILTRLEGIKELFYVPPIRKLAIAMLVILLLTVFFAATPIGHAIAENVIQYIVTLFDNGRLAVNRSDNAEPAQMVEHPVYIEEDTLQMIESTADCVHVESDREFTEITKREPFILPLPYTELYYEYAEEIDYLVLYVTYETKEGKIVTYQLWNVNSAEAFTSTGYTIHEADASIYYSIEEEEFIQCKKLLSDSVVTISAKGKYTLDEIIEILNRN